MQTTLDGWAALQAVVRLGGFAPAAERLNRSQSTISYAIARLQRQLGVKLFEMNARRAHLTEVGRLLLADAEPHLAGFRELEQRARSIASGGDIEIRLSVDSIFPKDVRCAIGQNTWVRMRNPVLVTESARVRAKSSSLIPVRILAGIPIFDSALIDGKVSLSRTTPPVEAQSIKPSATCGLRRVVKWTLQNTNHSFR